MTSIETRYSDGDYLRHNPEWDRYDAPWKAAHVAAILTQNGIAPASLCEIGCGSGDVLAHLRRSFPAARLIGTDISPQAGGFWQQHAGAATDIEFRLGAFHEVNREAHEVILLLDVIEHMRDPFSFLEQVRAAAAHFVLHIPLDLSASAVARRAPLLNVRRNVGHIHYFTKDLALEMLAETGYQVVAWHYTGASLRSPQRSLKTRLAGIPRRILYALDRDLGVRILGGDTLLVLARPAQ